jgi:hypothetical protein
VTTDPAPFLSTVVAASATLAAIIGGLLVARFVSLDSDQRGSRKVLADARGRLDAATERAKAAARDVVRFDAVALFGAGDVLAMIERGITTADALMRGRGWEHDEADLESYASEVTEEFSRARTELAARVTRPDSDWWTFKRVTPGLPEIRWPQVWKRVHDQVAMKVAEEADAQQRAAPTSLGLSSMLAGSAVARRRSNEMIGNLALAPGRGPIDMQRRDSLLARRERAAQQAEDCEGELRRLQQDHLEIARPDSRLWWGIAIVVAFLITGVALPLWAMSQGVKHLSSVQWMFWPFTAALAVLVLYIVVYLAQLTRREVTAGSDALSAIPALPSCANGPRERPRLHVIICDRARGRPAASGGCDPVRARDCEAANRSADRGVRGGW